MNLVLGTATKYNIPQVNLFVKSFRKYNKRDRVILLVSLESPPEYFEFLKKYDIDYSFFETYHFVDTHLNNSRFAKYMDILLDSKDTYDKVFLTDTRDIVFQSDPFANLPKEFLYFFEEEKESKIGVNPYNSSWMRMTFGEEVLQELYNSTIICAGTTIGNTKKILDYIGTMLAILHQVKQQNPEAYKVNIDQAIHNFIYYKTNHIAGMTAKQNGNIVGTIGLTREINLDKIVLKKEGMYVHDMKPAVIHQYDRSEEYTNFFKGLYD
ncbi:MAG: hypothetical protein EBU90_15685 [Proteobacteria bacterium]|nr:hypothetical protein [Pseudomonadota bacterium]NBP14480.1 hypothetical protein [bacterium]